MINGTEKYIETVKYLAKLYDYCNDNLFKGELRKPVITVQRDERNKTNGGVSLQKVWKENDKDDGDYELNMTAQQLNRPINEIVATMIHEMVHHYAKVNNMQDCSRSGTYHNKLFKRLAEMHGLNVECMPTIGWSHTTLTKDTAKLIETFVKDNPETLIYCSPVFKGQTVKTTSTRKYECPCCHNSVRATKQLNIVCGDCNQVMLDDKE